jgi:hypothetical protein
MFIEIRFLGRMLAADRAAARSAAMGLGTPTVEAMTHTVLRPDEIFPVSTPVRC